MPGAGKGVAGCQSNPIAAGGSATRGQCGRQASRSAALQRRPVRKSSGQALLSSRFLRQGSSGQCREAGATPGMPFVARPGSKPVPHLVRGPGHARWALGTCRMGNSRHKSSWTRIRAEKTDTAKDRYSERQIQHLPYPWFPLRPCLKAPVFPALRNGRNRGNYSGAAWGTAMRRRVPPGSGSTLSVFAARPAGQGWRGRPLQSPVTSLRQP